MIQIERIARFEVESVLAAFGSKPEPILPAEDVHVRLPRVRGDRGTPDPAEAGRLGAAGRARHHPPLVLGRNDDLRAGAVGEQDQVRVLFQERKIGFERSRRRPVSRPGQRQNRHGQ